MKHLIWIFVAAGMLYSCEEHSGYIIKGIVEGVDGQTVVLQEIQNFEPVVRDSVKVKKGKFELKGTVECPDFYLLYIGNNGPIQFFIENSIIKINVNTDSILGSKVTGSKENDIFASFETGMEDFNKKVKPLNDTYMSLRLAETPDTAQERSLLQQMDKIRETRTAYMSEFVKQHPNTVVSAFIVSNMLSRYMSTEDMESIVNSYDSTLNKSQWVSLLRDNYTVAKRTQNGQSFTDVTMLTPDDQTISLSDYAGKGKYVLIDFWASWCPPCRAANPHVVKLYNQYKDKGFEIVGISFDQEKRKWTDAIAADGLKWPQMSDLKYWQSEAAKIYSVNSIPHTILLDPEGKIIEKGLRVEQLGEKLAELLK